MDKVTQLAYPERDRRMSSRWRINILKISNHWFESFNDLRKLHMAYIAIMMGVIFFLNLPFGYWRANTKKFSLQWFLAIHLPIAAAIVLRLLFGLGWHLVTFPLFVGAYFAGQYLGGSLYSKRNRTGED
jgi:Kef-type K+ transport system membrane component KefB